MAVISNFPMGGSAELKRANGSKIVPSTAIVYDYYYDFTLTGLEFRPIVVYFYFVDNGTTNKFLLSDVSGSAVIGANGSVTRVPSSYSITDDGFKFYTMAHSNAPSTTVYWWAAGM